MKLKKAESIWPLSAEASGVSELRGIASSAVARGRRARPDQDVTTDQHGCVLWFSVSWCRREKCPPAEGARSRSMTASAALPRLVRVAVRVAVLLRPVMPSSVVYSKQPPRRRRCSM